MKTMWATVLIPMVAVAGLAGCTRSVTYADVEPILNKNCASCHTGDHEGITKSGFSVESYETVMKGTRLGPVIVPGSAASSTLFRLVAGEASPEINMPHSGDSLGDDQIATIRQWIDQGARK